MKMPLLAMELQKLGLAGCVTTWVCSLKKDWKDRLHLGFGGL